MFSYYGTKWKLAPLYAAPVFDTIIEPFAGAAGYSLYGDNWKRRVKLFDVNPKVVAVWRYLISADAMDIWSLPDVEEGASVYDFAGLTDAERYLIGFCINPGSTLPKVTATKRSKWPTYRARIAENVHKVKHWTVDLRSYADIPNERATWYIDPPYQKAGKYYFGFGALDFNALSLWTRARAGQIIVCENAGADWLPFRFLADHRGSMQKNVEVIWEADGPVEFGSPTELAACVAELT